MPRDPAPAFPLHIGRLKPLLDAHTLNIGLLFLEPCVFDCV